MLERCPPVIRGGVAHNVFVAGTPARVVRPRLVYDVVRGNEHTQVIPVGAGHSPLLAIALLELVCDTVVFVAALSRFWTIFCPTAFLAVLVLVFFVQGAVDLEDRRKAAVVWLGALEDHSRG